MDPDSFPVHRACREGKDQIALSLLETTPKQLFAEDEDGRLPIHWAISTGNLSLAQALAEKMGSKFDVDVTDSIGWSLLHIAVGLADLGEPIVMWLVGRDADVNMKNNAGQTPLHIAASKAYLANIRYLLEHGAKAAVKDSRQMATPLHRAAAVGSLPAVRLLLEHKCPVNATDRDGLTALHHAIAEGHGDVALELLRKGADPTKKDGEERLAIDLAPDGKVKAWIKENAANEGIEI